MKTPIENDCIYPYIDGNSEKQLMPNLLLVISIRELHNIMVSPKEEGELKEAIDTDNNIIISESTLLNILPPQLKEMTLIYKVMCGCECCISPKKFTRHYYHVLKFLKNLKIKAVLHKT